MRVALYTNPIPPNLTIDVVGVEHLDDPRLDADEIIVFNGTDSQMKNVCEFFNQAYEEETICVDTPFSWHPVTNVQAEIAGLVSRGHDPHTVAQITLAGILNGTALQYVL